MFVCLFGFLDSTCKWNHVETTRHLSLSDWPISLLPAPALTFVVPRLFSFCACIPFTFFLRSSSFFLKSSPEDMPTDFRERGWGGEREGEKHWCERETLIGTCPRGDQTRNLVMCPDQESDSWALSLRGDAPTTWATLARVRSSSSHAGHVLQVYVWVHFSSHNPRSHTSHHSQLSCQHEWVLNPNTKMTSGLVLYIWASFFPEFLSYVLLLSQDERHQWPLPTHTLK